MIFQSQRTYSNLVNCDLHWPLYIHLTQWLIVMQFEHRRGEKNAEKLILIIFRYCHLNTEFDFC